MSGTDVDDGCTGSALSTAETSVDSTVRGWPGVGRSTVLTCWHAAYRGTEAIRRKRYCGRICRVKRD
eukprot:593837-Rhodomonas_salina.2